MKLNNLEYQYISIFLIVAEKFISILDISLYDCSDIIN